MLFLETVLLRPTHYTHWFAIAKIIEFMTRKKFMWQAIPAAGEVYVEEYEPCWDYHLGYYWR